MSDSINIFENPQYYREQLLKINLFDINQRKKNRWQIINMRIFYCILWRRMSILLFSFTNFTKRKKRIYF